MSEESHNAGIHKIALSVLVAISLALASFALKWQFSANADIAVLHEQLDTALSNKAKDEAQDKTLSMHWKYLSWLRDQTTELRQKDGLPPVPSPNLNPTQ